MSNICGLTSMIASTFVARSHRHLRQIRLTDEIVKLSTLKSSGALGMKYMRVAAVAAFAILMMSTSAVFADDTFEADANAALKQLYADTPAAQMIADKGKAVLVFPNIV